MISDLLTNTGNNIIYSLSTVIYNHGNLIFIGCGEGDRSNGSPLNSENDPLDNPKGT